MKHQHLSLCLPSLSNKCCSQFIKCINTDQHLHSFVVSDWGPGRESHFAVTFGRKVKRLSHMHAQADRQCVVAACNMAGLFSACFLVAVTQHAGSSHVIILWGGENGNPWQLMQGLNHVHSAKSRRFSRWQLVAASDSLAHVIEVSLFVFLCGFCVMFFCLFSFSFFLFWRACFRAFAGKAGSVWDDLSLIWSFRLIKEVHSRVILPSCRGGFCSTCLKYAYDLVSSCRSRWHENPPQTLPLPHDATHRRTLVVCSSFAPFPKICFLQIFYRFQKSVENL